MIDLTRQLAEARAEIAATIQWRYEMAKKLADTEQQLAEARAANERLRETYKRVSSVHSDRASRMDDLQQQLAETRAVNKAAVAWVRSSREPMASADERMRLLEALDAVVADADEEIDV